MEAQSVIDRFAFKEYGQVIKVDPPFYNEKTGFYISNIKANYPVYIFDDRTPSDYNVRVLKIKHLGQITLNDKLQVIPHFTTYGEECRENLIKVLDSWKRQAENIVVSASSNQLTKIEDFRNHFSLIERIIDYLIDYNKIHNIELTRYLNKDDKLKIKRYVNLLEELELVRYEEPYYEIANKYTTIESATKNPKDLMTNILAYIIENRYPILRDEFKLTILEKTISIDSIIYLPEMELEEPIYRKFKSISDDYKKYYNKNINPLHLNQILRRLEKVGAIQRDGIEYFGDEELREDMITRKKKLGPLSIAPI